MNEPRICMVGAGVLSTRRIYPYVGVAGATIAGVCDLDTEKAERNARRFGGKPYTDIAAMLDTEQPDGVIVCVGPNAHAKLAVAIMEKGYPVYTEKPPAITAAEALDVARVSQQTGKLCVTAFKKRYAEAYQRAHEWLRKFPEEAWLSIGIDYCSAQYPNDAPERSFLLDFAIHQIDLAPYLFGDVTEVFAFENDGHAYTVSLKFANGAVGSMNLNDGRSFTVPTEDVELTARGGNWMTIRNSSSWRIAADGQPTEWREPSTFTSAGDSGRDTGHLSEIEAFVNTLKGGPIPPSNIYESYKSMVLYEAIRDAAEQEQPVRLKYETL